MNGILRTLWLKLFGWAMLSHIILIAISIFEVFIYSIFVNPGQEESVYNEHATQSAPYVAIIFGIVVFFFFARMLVKKRPEKEMFIALVLPFFYVVIDLAILIPYGVDWADHYLVFLLSFGTKILFSVVGAKSVKSSTA